MDVQEQGPRPKLLTQAQKSLAQIQFSQKADMTHRSVPPRINMKRAKLGKKVLPFLRE